MPNFRGQSHLIQVRIGLVLSPPPPVISIHPSGLSMLVLLQVSRRYNTQEHSAIKTTWNLDSAIISFHESEIICFLLFQIQY